MKHEHGPRCLMCEYKMQGAHSSLHLCYVDIKEEFPDYHVSDVFRDEMNQNFMNSRGLSDLMWPYSKHNFMINGKPCSLAMDGFRLTEKYTGEWNLDFFDRVLNLAKGKGHHVRGLLKLQSGKIDGPHLELISAIGLHPGISSPHRQAAS